DPLVRRRCRRCFGGGGRDPRLRGVRVTDALRFSKYQASGNDFVIIDELEGPTPEVDVPALCDRWVGAGADGVIRARPGAAASFRFDLTNADGSSAEMSGNGMRCLAAYLRE